MSKIAESPKSFAEYKRDCTKAINQGNLKQKALIEYIRRGKQPKAIVIKDGQTFSRRGRKPPVGVLVAFVQNNQLYFGWSLCNIQLDQYDQAVGIAKAYRRAQPIKGPNFENLIPRGASFEKQAGRFIKHAIQLKEKGTLK